MRYPCRYTVEGEEKEIQRRKKVFIQVCLMIKNTSFLRLMLLCQNMPSPAPAGIGKQFAW